MSTDRPTVVITGSGGLIGSALCRRLAGGYRVFGFDRPSDTEPPPEAVRVEVDLTSDEQVRAGMAEVERHAGRRIASVIHLAAFYDFSGEDSPLYDEVTVRGTERLLAALDGFEVGQFAFGSTMLVHAPGERGERIDEDSPLKATWAYPESKLKTERLLTERRGTIPVVLWRIAAVYTEWCHSIPLAQQIRRVHERDLTGRVYPGDTEHGQAFVHMEDLLDALEATVNRRAELPPVTPLLLGEPDTYSYGAINAELGRLIHGTEWETYWVPKLVAKAGAWVQDKVPFVESPFIKPWMVDRADDHYELDVSRAGELLGWRPSRRLWETLPRMVENLKSDAAKWYAENDLPPPDGADEKPEGRDES